MKSHPHRQRGPAMPATGWRPSLELIEKGNLDYISYECLAERTIAIGQQAKLKDPSKGYNGLLEHRMERALPLCWKHKVQAASPTWAPPTPRPPPRSAWRLPTGTD